MNDTQTQKPITGNGLDFERPIVELENQIEELKKSSEEKKIDLSQQIAGLQDVLEQKKRQLYGNLQPWQKVQLARHPNRPLTLDFVDLVFSDFIELHGDRCFGDDKAMVGGVAMLSDHRVMIIGQQKGKGTRQNIIRNFGSPHPEGYRKALRLMRMAEKFNLPVICLIDTPGAYPGVGAEERGQAWAIAENIKAMMLLETPVISVITGEGCSGGALGIGVGDIVAIFQYAYYSVISPEGCAAILWKDAAKMTDAAKTLGLTAPDLIKHKLVDYIIPEPLGGAHRDPEQMGKNLKSELSKYLDKLKNTNIDDLLEQRYAKFRSYGAFIEKTAPKTAPGPEAVQNRTKDEDEQKHVQFPNPFRKAE
jgi:acetyl-CoA carboxylase carboxyl transferase subunit alpha